MHLYLQGHDFHFELENVSRLFLPLEKISTHPDGSPIEESDGLRVIATMAQEEQGARLSCGFSPPRGLPSDF